VVSRLDVVAELAAHQHNLVPEPVASRRVVDRAAGAGACAG